MKKIKSKNSDTGEEDNPKNSDIEEEDQAPRIQIQVKKIELKNSDLLNKT